MESTEKEEIPLPDNGYRTTFRMEGDLDSFAQYGGEEAFIKMLAEQLGIDPSYININSVKTGSVVLEFDINIPPESGINPEDVKEKQAQLIASGAISHGGAAVLDVQTQSAGEEPESQVKDGKVQIVNGLTKKNFIASLQKSDLEQFLCANYMVTLIDTVFTDCSLDGSTLHQYLPSSEMTITNNQLAAPSIQFKTDSSLNDITIASQ